MAETQDQPQVVLHWLNKSRAQRILWLLEECKDLDFTIKTYTRGADFLAPAELKKVHPLGKSPIITIATANNPEPIVLAETGLIVEYLCDHFAQHLIPKRYQEGKEGQVGGETESWLRYRFYMHYAEGSIMSLLLITMIVDQIGDNPQTPFFLKPITRAISSRIYAAFLTSNHNTHFTFLESQLASAPAGGPYLCGAELTAADITMSFPLLAARMSKRIDKVKYPKLMAYCELLEGSGTYRASVERIEKVSGEEYKLL
ncbi:hypothetical protein LTR62_008035 [Meristemomyces frigidus]|uniref:GST N-terminal domain-containing protein n=1 Tax=Meristemomyces frigidus TaxID=1508187 RepID=A0AAN7YIS5_9PEZI|nr:hypothetical protein LTR62_008035 [Meristemomyces frigidus]